MGSCIFSVEALDRSDFEGNVDCEKGVVGEVSAAAAFDSFTPFAKDVARVRPVVSFVFSAGVEWCAADMLM